MKLSLRIGISASVATAVVLLMTRSIVIASAFGALAAGIAFVTVRTKNTLNEAALIAAWPEVIDHLMSGIQSGLSLSESLAGLATRGPEILRPSFLGFKATLFSSGDLGEAIKDLKSTFSHHGSERLTSNMAGLRTLHIFQLQLPGFFCCSYQLNQVQLWLIRLHLVH